MASKPRTLNSSPTNLSPSRVAIRNSSRSSGGTNGPKKGPSSPLTTHTAGRTPQTRRKELALQQNSPVGSPKNSSVRKTPSTGTPGAALPGSQNQSRKNSLKNSQNSAGNRRQPRVRALSATTQQLPHSPVKLREETKFDGLWDVKTIRNGCVKIPTQCLDDLITKDSIDKFYVVEDTPVASGNFCTVRKCVHRETGITYAAKFSSRKRMVNEKGVDCSMDILHEIAILSVCTDSNKIVHLKDVFQNRHEIILVLEYAPGGDFQSVLDNDMVPFEEDVQGFLRQTLEALDFIHERNIAHMDIKPQNIVLMGPYPNCEIKLCDLEVARVIKEDEDICETIGTPDYVAPEILNCDPITLSADIWSLGVLAYVLLTGFTPFGGDNDTETFQNVTTAPLDFPFELFEGVSDMAKEFITLCLNRDPQKRPSVKECLNHVWLAQEDEPPSPSPLMLKIPTPDLSEPVLATKHNSHGHGHGPGHANGSLGPSSTRRSCQTCRDKIIERKRYLSKSREAIFEKVAQSNLKKSLSKSRERLDGMRLTLSRSRDNLGLSDLTKVASRPQEKLYGFKNLSKSQEVISAALGGVPMKRMVNGAVSDISYALKPGDNSSELPSPSMDFIFVPGSGILVPPSELLKNNSGSLQVLPMTESGRSTPASTASTSQEPSREVQTEAKFPVVPLIEVSEEDENSSTASRASSVPKDIKESQNYEKQKRDQKSKSSLTEKKEVGIQVNLIPADPIIQNPVCNKILKNSTVSQNSPRLSRKLANLAKEPEEMNIDLHLIRNNKANYQSKTLPRRKSNNDVPKLMKQSSVEESKERTLRRGYTHDALLGVDPKSNKPAWMTELKKIKSLKPNRVTELIGTFDKKGTNEITDETELAELKQKRRGSLQIHLDASEIGTLAKMAEEREKRQEALLKSQRRKSTPILINSHHLETMKIEEQINNTLRNHHSEEEEKKDDEKPEKNLEMSHNGDDQARKDQKNWDYFEIDHPKAISDKKLQQLKAKYLRRRTEGSLGEKSISEESEADLSSNEKKGKDRSQSVPVVSLAEDVAMEIESSEKLRRISTDSGEESATTDSSRKSSGQGSIYRRRSSHLSEFLSSEPPAKQKMTIQTTEDHDDDSDHKMTSAIQSEEKKRRRLSVETHQTIKPEPNQNQAEDDGFISLPHTPTDLMLDPKLKIAGTSSVSSTTSTNDDGIFTSSEETLMKVTTSSSSCDIDSSRPSSAASKQSEAEATRRQSSPMIRPSSS